MKKWFVLIWLLVPVALLSYHFGPGQEALAWREAQTHLAEARQLEHDGRWEQAVTAYQQTLGALPAHPQPAKDEAQARDQLRLSQIRARFQLGYLAESIAELRLLAEDVERTHGADSPLTFDVRDLLGRVHFQAMVALRLESAEEEVWKRHWELSRQNFRYLAEHTRGRRNHLDRQNLEAVIKSANLPEEAFASPSGGGVASTSALSTPTKTTTPPPPIVTDNRITLAPPSNVEVTPPEFELGN